VRAFQPDAAAAWVVTAGDETSMARLHDAGFYEAILPGAELPVRYHLRLEGADGQSWTVDDPYRYPASLGELDEYLMAEGTDIYLYRKLGAHLIALAAPGDEPVAGVRFAVWAPSAE